MKRGSPVSALDFPFSSRYSIPRRDRVVKWRRKKDATDLLWFIPFYLAFLLILIDATYPHNSNSYTSGIPLKYPLLPSLPIPVDLPHSAAESANEGRSIAPAQRGGDCQQRAEESASEPPRRPPAQCGWKFDKVIADSKPQSKCSPALSLFIYFYPIKIDMD